ncbi:hypothetical protein JCM10212_000565 [Sporobolomyces blumeae]
MTEPCDHYLTLSFPSLSSFLASTSHLDRVAALARSVPSSLLVRIRSGSSEPSPWTLPNERDRSGSSSAASSSSSRTPPPPRRLWLPLERSLAALYSAATVEFLKRDNPLARVDVVLEAMRGVPFCVPPGADSSEWTPNERQDTSTSDDDAPRGGESYEVVALGGTFDHLHAGHKILLTMASSLATRKIIVGVSGDELLKTKKYKEHLEPLEKRITSVQSFIELVRPTIQAEIVPLHDVYGPTASDPDIQALVVSEETKTGGQAINKLRGERNLSILDTHVINLVSDDGSSASSESTPARAGPTRDGGSLDDGDASAVSGEPVKVAVETKMGSTGIREWLARRDRSERGAQRG